MQQLLVGVHDVLETTGDRDTMKVGGIVMHARPETDREWTVLRNAYTRIEALWLTPLPLRSPFEEEELLLAYVPLDEAESGASDYLKGRLAFCRDNDADWPRRVATHPPAPVDPHAVFWGMPLDGSAATGWSGRDHPVLRPGSRFGHCIRATTTFAAVGSAMQRARLNAPTWTAPAWHQFEMPAILRSYFDPPIVAAILRWLEPHEAWWGDREEDAGNVVAEALARATDDDRKILLPELLLAAALGKVPKSGRDLLLSEADHYIACATRGHRVASGGSPWSDRDIAPVRAGALAVRLRAAAGDHVDRAAGMTKTVAALWAAGSASVDPDQLSRAAARLLPALEQFVATVGGGSAAAG
jgi:hypothetical protein